MSEQLSLFPEEEIKEQPPTKKKPKKKEKPPALLEGKVYHQFPKAPDYKHIPSVDPEMPHHAWSAQDWDLHLNHKHPHITYTEEQLTRFKNRMKGVYNEPMPPEQKEEKQD